MKIRKAALDATVEAYEAYCNADGGRSFILKDVEFIIQAYSERLPDLVGALNDLLMENTDGLAETKTTRKSREVLEEMEE